MAWPCYSGLFPSPSSFMSTCVGGRISLPTFVTLAINTQVTSSYATSCISRMNIRRAAILFPRPSFSRAHRIAALCDEGRLADTLRHCFGGLLLVGINVLQPLCDEGRLADTLRHCFGSLLLVGIDVLQIPIELRLRYAY